MLSFFHGGKEITISKSVSFMGVPEPSTTVLLAAGLAFLMARSRRRV
jgi:hypothetical protein